MRASPAIHVSLRCFGAWRVAVLALTGSGLIVMGAWLLQREQLPWARVVVGIVCATLLLAWLGVSLAKVSAVDLGWDGQGWSLRSLRTQNADAVAGEVSVAIDFGSWMLLRFRPLTASRWRRPTWLPVQRRGIEPQWHALRCAVHAPRPPPVVDAPQPR